MLTFSTEIEAIALPILERHDCNLVQGTFRREKSGLVLRLLVERRGAVQSRGSGVDLKLCSSISKDLSAALDVDDIVEEKYTLEVSSPGIERPLVRLEDFERFSGSQVLVRTTKAINGHRRFKGMLGGLADGAISLTTRNGEKIIIPHEVISKANIAFDPKGSKTNSGDR